MIASAGWGFTYIFLDNNTRPLRWSFATATVSLRILLGTDQTLIDGSNFSTSAQAGAQTWNVLLGSIQFQPTIAPGPPGSGNHVNELAFGADIFGKAFDANTLAVTTTWTNGAGTRRTEGDIIFNSAKTWNSYPGNLRRDASGTVNPIDLHRVAIHEMGHLLGLDHPDEAGQTVSAIMNSHVSNLDTLSMDDITGALNLYGPPGMPANDNYASATVITGLTSSGSVTVNGFNSLATRETGEPTHASNAGARGRSVWWKWTAPANGSVTVDTVGSYFDTTLGVYTGTSVAALTTIDTNDDVQTGVIIASTITFSTTTGTVYYFAVDGFENDNGGAESGGIILNVAFTPSGGTLPTITTQPASTTTTVGNSATFTVAATAGSSAISYQWQFNGTAVSGATNATLTLSNVTTASAGSYTVVVSTSAGMVTSSAATLTVNAAPAPAPAPTPAPRSGGGGGGAPSGWFIAALSLLAAARWHGRNLRAET